MLTIEALVDVEQQLRFKRKLCWPVRCQMGERLVSFSLVSLFNRISTFDGHLIPTYTL